MPIKLLPCNMAACRRTANVGPMLAWSLVRVRIMLRLLFVPQKCPSVPQLRLWIQCCNITVAFTFRRAAVSVVVLVIAVAVCRRTSVVAVLTGHEIVRGNKLPDTVACFFAAFRVAWFFLSKLTMSRRDGEHLFVHSGFAQRE